MAPTTMAPTLDTPESAQLQFETHITLGIREFDLMDPVTAYYAYINKHRIKPSFFLNDSGERCIWGPDIDCYWSSKSKDEAFQKAFEGPPHQWGKFLSNRGNQHDQTVNAQPYDKTMMVTHPSESGWNLPVSHSRHILKLPQEILLSILGHVLVIPKAMTLGPLAVPCNLVTWFNRPHFEIRGGYRTHISSEESASEIVDNDDPCGLPTLAWIPRQDEAGQYTEMRYINRKIIDASCLRACRAFLNIGQCILYNANSFEFAMMNTDWNSCPPSWDGGEFGRYRPCPSKPGHNEKWINAVAEGMSAVRDQIRLTKLPGWIYYDRFLRFLHTIGPKNAVLIKSLTFRGTIQIHRCEYEMCGLRCEDDLLDSLQLYLPFIKMFCPELKKLTICADHDRTIRDASISALFPPAPRPLNEGELKLQDDLLSRFLEHHLQFFLTLEDLDVVDVSKGEHQKRTFEVARSIISRVKEEADQRARAASSLSRLRQDSWER